MKTIKCYNGMEILVDDEDYAELAKFTWSIMQTKNRRGKGVKGNPYAFRRELGKSRGRKNFYLANVLMNPGEDELVDHIDGNTLNNQKYNLRVTTNKGNCCAFKRKNPGTSSKYKGVTWDKAAGKWAAKINQCVPGTRRLKTYNLGKFHSEEEAALAYNQGAIDLGYFPEALNKVA